MMDRAADNMGVAFLIGTLLMLPWAWWNHHRCGRD